MQRKSNYFVYKTQSTIKVEAHGNYQIEVTNIINANSMKVVPIIPSLMSHENMAESLAFLSGVKKSHQ